jgi:transcriptional activator HAC1
VKLARANAELEAYRANYGPLPAHVVLPEVTLSTADPDAASTPAPSLLDSRGSVDYSASPSSPAEKFDDLYDTEVPIKLEPDLTYPTPASLAPTFDLPELHQKPSQLSLLDSTQHPAEMLCDLPCRSRQRSSNNPASWWSTLFLYIMSLHFQTTYKTFLMAVWTHSPSQMARMIRASTRGLTSRSMTGSRTIPLLLSRSTAALAQRKAATRRLVVGQGESALQQREEPGHGQKTTEIPATVAEQHRTHHGSTDTKAFEEQHAGESSLGRDDEHSGVGR